MQNWIFGAVAIGLWAAASLLYLRRYIAIWFAARRQRRAARGAQIKR